MGKRKEKRVEEGVWQGEKARITQEEGVWQGGAERGCMMR